MDFRLVGLLPSLSLTASRTRRNLGLPFRRRQPSLAAITRLNTVVTAVRCDRQPVLLTVRRLTVANTLSIGFVVLTCRQCSAGKS